MMYVVIQKVIGTLEKIIPIENSKNIMLLVFSVIMSALSVKWITPYIYI